MRNSFVVFVLVVASGSAIAQQHVVRNGADPKQRGQMTIAGGPTCAMVALGQGGTQPGDPCDVAVYNTVETDQRITDTKTATLAECKQYVETAKAGLSQDINKLPATVREALKAQIKEEIKAEVIKE